MERFGQPVRNGLHGHKSRLLTRLREEKVPDWLYPSHPIEAGGNPIRVDSENPRTEFLRRWKEMAKHFSHRRVIGYRIYTSTDEAHDDEFPLFDIRPRVVPAPDPIRSRCIEYLDSPRHRSELRATGGYGTFDGFHVNIVVGPQNGIQSIHLSADYLR